jgi:hypothetical protein
LREKMTMLDKIWVDWVAWWATVTPEFAFLLALPFVVAVIGLLAEKFGQHHHRP